MAQKLKLADRIVARTTHTLYRLRKMIDKIINAQLNKKMEPHQMTELEKKNTEKIERIKKIEQNITNLCDDIYFDRATIINMERVFGIKLAVDWEDKKFRTRDREGAACPPLRAYVKEQLVRRIMVAADPNKWETVLAEAYDTLYSDFTVRGIAVKEKQAQIKGTDKSLRL